LPSLNRIVDTRREVSRPQVYYDLTSYDPSPFLYFFIFFGTKISVLGH
jgi:hypothetical protein